MQKSYLAASIAALAGAVNTNLEYYSNPDKEFQIDVTPENFIVYPDGTTADVEVDPGLYPAVFRWPIASPRCGGTMISPRMALTAAHCVNESEDESRSLSMQIELQDGSGNYTTYDIVDIRAHDCWWTGENPYGYNSYASDIAFLVLDRDITPNGGTPVEGTHYLSYWDNSVDGDTLTGETFILAGWGQSGEIGTEYDDSDQDGSMTVFNRGYNIVDSISSNMINYTLTNPADGGLELESMAHYGDSGSGALYIQNEGEADEVLRIIGVKSNGSSTAYWGSSHQYTFVGDYHTTWIQANLDSVDTEVIPDGCVSTIYENCTDTNYDADGNELADSYGDPCSAYVGNTDWCGSYNTDTFINTEMCCACDGGCTGDDCDATDDSGNGTGSSTSDESTLPALEQAMEDLDAAKDDLLTGDPYALQSFDQLVDFVEWVENFSIPDASGSSCTVRGTRQDYEFTKPNGTIKHKFDFVIYYLNGDCDGSDTEDLTFVKGANFWTKHGTLYTGYRTDVTEDADGLTQTITLTTDTVYAARIKKRKNIIPQSPFDTVSIDDLNA